jgi:hypothetical protein
VNKAVDQMEERAGAGAGAVPCVLHCSQPGALLLWEEYEHGIAGQHDFYKRGEGG